MGIFFYIDLKYSFEFISSLFEDFLTTSRYWSFSNKTQLNWALKWFISNRIFLDLSLLFRIYSWYCRFNLMLSTSVVIYLAYKIKQLRCWMKLNKNIDTKVNTVLQSGGWFLSNTDWVFLSQMLCQLHMGEMKIIESHFVYSLDYTIKISPFILLHNSYKLARGNEMILFVIYYLYTNGL